MTNHHLRNFLQTKDYLVTGELFNLLYDEQRDMLITSPAPPEAMLGTYYESDRYISHSDETKGALAFIYQRVKRIALKRKLKLINKLNAGIGSLADIGSGTASFLETAALSGWEITGVEPSEKARKIASQSGISLNESLNELKGKQFDVVTLWHVLEHLPNLEWDIKLLNDILKPGGHLIIAVPNFKSYDAHYYKEYWAAYDVPRHLWHFSKSAIKLLFADKLELVNIKPMLFDSVYVSLLSEKYKTGRSFSLRGILVGLWSNLRGLSTREYSSHIYCFKKPN